jgi:hypothetical protein
MAIDFKVGGGSEPLTPQDDQVALEKAEEGRLEDQREAFDLLPGSGVPTYYGGPFCWCACHHAAPDPVAQGKEPHERACCVYPDPEGGEKK